MPYEPLKVEKEILELWEKEQVPQKITDFQQNFARTGKKFYVLDGPPYLTNKPHVGNIMNTFNKDLISKFKQMQGFAVWWQPGFDVHGLPLEVKVEKKLNITKKQEIMKDVDNFIKECDEYTDQGYDDWMPLFKKMACWRGWVEPYLTKTPEYIESSWWSLKELYTKNLLSKGVEPVTWCPRCQTALAGYEVTDSYTNLTDSSIYIKFPIVEKEKTFFLVWTTTPWTLPANVAIIAHPDEKYVKVEINGEKLILAKKRLEAIMKEAKITEGEYKIAEEIEGKQLKGMEYLPVIDCAQQRELSENPKSRKVYLSIPILKQKAAGKIAAKKEIEQDIDFGHLVDMETGSGLVHCAPGHGDVDAKIGKHYKLPAVSPLDDECRFTEKVEMWKGQQVKDANEQIIEFLKEKNTLFFDTKITHSCAVCWRCKTPLITRLSEQWFIDVPKIKDKMLENLNKTKWAYESSKQQEINWVKNAEDWAISRDRFWGIPLPVWICEKCKKEKIIGSFEELENEMGAPLPKNFDPHLNSISKINLTCDCNGEMKHCNKVLDVIFDSGVAAWASLHYPFENKDLYVSLDVPDYISEAEDQIRLWFYNQLVLSTAIFNKLPYKSVLMGHFILDEQGQKMSKSVGNTIDPQDILNEYGTDLYRLYIFTSNMETKINFSKKFLGEGIKNLITFDNILNYYNTYCNHNITELNKTLLKNEDSYILSKINNLIKSATQDLEDLKPHLAIREIIDFGLNDLSRNYVKAIRDRVKESEEEKNNISAILRYVLDRYLRLLAPFAPFFAEYCWRALQEKKEQPIQTTSKFASQQGTQKVQNKSLQSIHLQSWPLVDETLINSQIEQTYELFEEIRERANFLRNDNQLSLRWPIEKITFEFSKNADKQIISLVEQNKSEIKKAANSFDVEIIEKETKKEILVNYKTLGKKYKELLAKIENYVKENLEIIDNLPTNIEIDGKELTLEKEDIILRSAAIDDKTLSVGEDFNLRISTNETNEIKEQRLLAELKRAIQVSRKDANLNIIDEIDLKINGPEFLKKFERELKDAIGAKTIIFVDDDLNKKAEYKYLCVKFGF